MALQLCRLLPWFPGWQQQCSTAATTTTQTPRDSGGPFFHRREAFLGGCWTGLHRSTWLSGGVQACPKLEGEPRSCGSKFRLGLHRLIDDGCQAVSFWRCLLPILPRRRPTSVEAKRADGHRRQLFAWGGRRAVAQVCVTSCPRSSWSLEGNVHGRHNEWGMGASSTPAVPGGLVILVLLSGGLLGITPRYQRLVQRRQACEACQGTRCTVGLHGTERRPGPFVRRLHTRTTMACQSGVRCSATSDAMPRPPPIVCHAGPAAGPPATLAPDPFQNPIHHHIHHHPHRRTRRQIGFDF